MELTGKRMTAQECQAAHIVTRVCALEDLMPTVMAFAEPLQKGRAIIAELKARSTKAIVHAVDVLDPPYINSGKFQYLD